MNASKPAAGPAIPESSSAQAVSRATAKKTKPAPKASAGSKARPTTRPQTKQDRVLAMLRDKRGTTIAAVMKATGWQKHSVHGFFAGVVRKRLELKLESKKVGDERIYHVEGGAPPKAGPAQCKRRQT